MVRISAADRGQWIAERSFGRADYKALYAVEAGGRPRISIDVHFTIELV